MDESTNGRKILLLGFLLSGAITHCSSLTTFGAPTRSSPCFIGNQVKGRKLCAPLKASKKNPIFEYDDDDDDDEDDSFEYARVRRGRGGKRFSNDNLESEESKSTRSASSGKTDSYNNRKSYDSEYDEINFDRRKEVYDDDDEDFLDDDYDEDDDDYDEFDGIIPNPLLDQIDPDGAIERLPELFSYKKFWKDSTIWFFLGFLYLLNRFNNPMLNGVVDLDKVDFTQFYNTAT